MNITINRSIVEQALKQLRINRTNFRKGPSKSICKMLAGGNDDVILALEAALAEPEPVCDNPYASDADCNDPNGQAIVNFTRAIEQAHGIE